MERNENLYSDWLVVEAGGKQYLGRLVTDPSAYRSPLSAATYDPLPPGYVVLDEAFECFSMRIPAQDQRGNIMAQNVSGMAPELYCTDGTRVRLWPSKIRFISELSPHDHAKHIEVIRQAQKMFAEARAAQAGIVVTSQFPGNARS